MRVNDEVKSLKEELEKLSCEVQEMMNINKTLVDKVQGLVDRVDSINSDETNETTEEEYEEERATKGDYVSYYDYKEDSLVIGKIVEDGNYNFQIYYPLSNQVDYCAYDTIDELLEDYSGYEDFRIINVGKYSNMIPNETPSYVLYQFDDSTGKGHLIDVSIGETFGKKYLATTSEMKILVEGNYYDEIILDAMLKYTLVIPVREK